MIVLYDEHITQNFIPFSYTRHVAEISVGIFTIQEKWQKLTSQPVELVHKKQAGAIPANIIPTKENYWLIKDACASEAENVFALEGLIVLHYAWDIYKYNAIAIAQDSLFFDFGKYGMPNNNAWIYKESIYIAPSAKVNRCMLNAEAGPIVINEGAEVMEGSYIRGPFYLGKNAIVKMGTHIYGATTVSKNCIVGGEIKNSIFLENSNKAHYGYIGDSIIGAYCNLGAGTSCSNVKNNAAIVKYQLQQNAEPIAATQKAGLLMGDYSKAAINTSFYTGTVVGICCNVFGHEIPSTFVPSFSWGKTERYKQDKLIQDINNWLAFKKETLNEKQIENLTKLYNTI
jgi:UDP-N-acetylglucosamine diphosphorylase / glucose-1-phosphate thymidylyltransferase / UDP-N-acetylgalactosamine diphosphorylase / glucosamine-1-phosphate N-acetyltransferase / galactosamine-1-phosphate N-acetyltransferase